MANITEQDVISPFIGKKIIDTLPDDLAGEFIVYKSNYFKLKYSILI